MDYVAYTRPFPVSWFTLELNLLIISSERFESEENLAHDIGFAVEKKYMLRTCAK